MNPLPADLDYWKPWYRSRTIAIAMIVGAVGGIEAVFGFIDDTRMLGTFIVLREMLNIVLRFLTHKPIQ